MFTKATETEQGENAEYFAPTRIVLDVKTKSLEVHLGLWKNKNKYDNNRKPYQVRRFELTDTAFPFSNARVTNMLEDVRTKIIAVDSFFADAVVD